MYGWSLLVMTVLVLWCAGQASPEMSEQFDSWRHEFAEFWSFHRTAADQLLPGEIPRALVDESRARYQNPPRVPVYPQGAIPHPNHPQTFYRFGHEFSY